MKLVKEHINFKRGIDPKDAMQIGDVLFRRREIIKKELREAVKILVHALKVKKDSVKEDFDGAQTNIEFKGKYKSETGKYRHCLYAIGYNFTLNDYWVLADVYKIYGKHLDDPDDTNVKHFSTIDECMMQIHSWAYEPPPITESINFKRGLDPKDAMQIGTQDKQRLIQKMEEAYRRGYSNQNEEHWGFTPKLWHATIRKILYPTTKIEITDKQILINAPSFTDRHIILITNALNYITPDPFNIRGVSWNSPYKTGKLTFVGPTQEDVFIDESINFERGLDPKDAMGTGDVIHRKLKKIQIELLKAAKILVHDFNLDPKTIETKFGLKEVEVTFNCHGAPERTAFIGFSESNEDRINQCYAGFEDSTDSTLSYHSNIPECMQRMRNLLEK